MNELITFLKLYLEIMLNQFNLNFCLLRSVLIYQVCTDDNGDPLRFIFNVQIRFIFLFLSYVHNMMKNLRNFKDIVPYI